MRRELLVEQRVHGRDHLRGALGADDEWRGRALRGVTEGTRRIDPARDHDAANAEREEHLGRTELLLRSERLGVAQLGFPQHLNAAWHDTVNMPDQRQARLLDAWMADLPPETCCTPDEPHVQPQCGVVEQSSNANPVWKQRRGLRVHGYFSLAS